MAPKDIFRHKFARGKFKAGEKVIRLEYIIFYIFQDDYMRGDPYRDEYVIQTLNTAAPPSTLHVDEQLKNFEYKYNPYQGWVTVHFISYFSRVV